MVIRLRVVTGTAMRRLVREFNAEFEGQINVQETFMSELEYYESLNITIPMKRAYDVALVHSYKVAAFANKNLLFPIADLIEEAKIEISREDYLPDVFDSMLFDEQLYGVPLDIHTTVLYYNQDLLDQYSATVPTKRSELIAAAKKCLTPMRVAGECHLPRHGRANIFIQPPFINLAGVEIDSEANPSYNNQIGVDALKSVADLIHVEKISPLNVSVDSDLMLFNQGKAMFHINGDWMINSMKESGINFGVTSLSKMFNETGASADKNGQSRPYIRPATRS